ncbi:ABC transporter permease subunit [Flavihumibacter sp. R14]|nr:ABC transporter permease subunit [Flavihumibacter soli]
MNLLISLRSELLKIKGSSTWILTIIAAAIVPTLMIMIFDSDSREDLKSVSADPWNYYFGQARALLSMVFLPMFIVMISTMLPQIEYRNNTWKQVLTSPQPMWNIWLSRFMVVQLLIIVFLIAHSLLMGVSGVVLNTIHPAFKFYDHGVDWQKYLSGMFNTYISVAAISAIQFWAGIRIKNFILPIAIGFTLWLIAGFLFFEMPPGYADKYPFAFPLLSSFPKYAAVVPEVLWTSLAYTGLFLVIGYVDFRFRKVKG